MYKNKSGITVGDIFEGRTGLQRKVIHIMETQEYPNKPWKWRVVYSSRSYPEDDFRIEPFNTCQVEHLRRWGKLIDHEE